MIAKFLSKFVKLENIEFQLITWGITIQNSSMIKEYYTLVSRILIKSTNSGNGFNEKRNYRYSVHTKLVS